MCVITLIKHTQTATRADLKNMADDNPHGIGLLFYNKQKQGVLKDLPVKGLGKILKTLAKDKFDVILHFRFATHGKIDESNIHPFDLGNGRWLMHNGICSGFGNDTLSDTHELALTLAPLDTHRIYRILTALNEAGQGKFVILDKDTPYLIGDFEDHKGLLVSNRHFCRPMWSKYDNDMDMFLPKPSKSKPTVVIPADLQAILTKWDLRFEDLVYLTDADIQALGLTDNHLRLMDELYS